MFAVQAVWGGGGFPVEQERISHSQHHSLQGELVLAINNPGIIFNDPQLIQTRITLQPQDGKLYLRRHEGIKDWFNMIQVQCIFLWCQELVCGASFQHCICIFPTLYLYPSNIAFVSFQHCPLKASVYESKRRRKFWVGGNPCQDQPR